MENLGEEKNFFRFRGQLKISNPRQKVKEFLRGDKKHITKYKFLCYIQLKFSSESLKSLDTAFR